MNLKIMLPSQLLADKSKVLRLVMETSQGSWGILPHRRDCVANLVPGVLTFETAAEGVAYVAVDLGIMIKTGRDVHISVRRAIRGADLARLRNTVEHDFAAMSQTERELRHVSDKLENGFLRSMVALHHE
jgi:F-type H+-transporting ATPase subunit epsilon